MSDSDIDVEIVDFFTELENANLSEGDIFYVVSKSSNDTLQEYAALKLYGSSVGTIDITSPKIYLNGVDVDDIKTVIKYFKDNN